MKHAEKIIARVLFLEGFHCQQPEKDQYWRGRGCPAQERPGSGNGSHQSYNDGIRLCLELGDNGTRELIDANLHDEEEHLDWLEAQLDQITQMGLQNYLLGQAE